MTQMVSWVLMVLSEPGWLIQVSTGEGKSCIVAMFAAFRAKKSETVDIMSSSRVLAERDYIDWKTFYEIMGISVDCNTSTSRDEAALKKCYQCQVVYGPDQFAGDVLKQQFHRMNIRGERQFQCAIVDEADSLMLDRAHYTVYLSSDMPALQHLNPLLALIWQTVNRYDRINSQTPVGPECLFQDIVLENLNRREDVDKFTVLQMAEDAGILLQGTVHDIQNSPSLLGMKINQNCHVTATQMAEFFRSVEIKYSTCRFVLHVQNDDGTLEELNPRSPVDSREKLQVPLLYIKGGICRYIYSDRESLISAVEETVKGFMQFKKCAVSDDATVCQLPRFLDQLVKSKLKLWISNAFTAQTMSIDKDYIVEHGMVVPVDYRYTGVVQSYMQWSDWLQQFLEIDQLTKMSNMTVTTNFMSYYCLFQKYSNQIYGVTGTLGNQSERAVFQKLYEGVKTCNIPSFKRRKLFEVQGLIVVDDNEWLREVCKVVKVQTSPTPFRAKRAVLVICETINKAKAVYNALGNDISQKKLYINNNCDNSAIFQKKLEAGNVIIATNLAGRGTDFAVSDQVNEAGGLFVLQTFLTPNGRVEQQAFGRTARQGSPGCAQLVVCLDRHSTSAPCSISQVLLQVSPETHASRLTAAKKARDVSVENSLSSYVEDDIKELNKKEDLFRRYLVILDEFYKSYSNKPPKSAVDSLNETWGLWLLMHFDKDNSIQDLTSRMEADMKAAWAKVALRHSPSSNIHHYTGFGNDLREAGMPEESIVMYTRAIKEDGTWAAIALYNRAMLVLSQRNRRQDESCMNQALADLDDAHRSIQFYQKQIEATLSFSNLATRNPYPSATMFEKHMSKNLLTLELFKIIVKNAYLTLLLARSNHMVVEVKQMPALITLVQQRQWLNITLRVDTEILESMGLTHIFYLVPQFSVRKYMKRLLNW